MATARNITGNYTHTINPLNTNGTTTTVTDWVGQWATPNTVPNHTYAPSHTTWDNNPIYFPQLDPGFNCYASTEGRIAPGKLEVIFQLLAESKLDYAAMLKHLDMEERLFNTVLLEYALKYKPRFFIEMLSHKQAFTKEELFNQVVKSYQ